MLMLTHTIIGGKKKMKNTMHNLTNRGVCDIISSKYLIHTYKKDKRSSIPIRTFKSENNIRYIHRVRQRKYQYSPINGILERQKINHIGSQMVVKMVVKA